MSDLTSELSWLWHSKELPEETPPTTSEDSTQEEDTNDDDDTLSS